MALGQLGLSLADFCALTPAEFTAAATAHERQERAAWERARLICGCTLQPYAEAHFDIRKALPYPWDEGGESDGERGERGARKLTREEELAEFERAKAAYGLR